MNLYIVNESSVVDDSEISAILPALTVYTRHIRNWWGSMQPGIFFQKPLVKEAWQIIIADDWLVADPKSPLSISSTR